MRRVQAQTGPRGQVTCGSHRPSNLPRKARYGSRINRSNINPTPVEGKQPWGVLCGVSHRLASFYIGGAVERFQCDPLWSFALQGLHFSAFELLLCCSPPCFRISFLVRRKEPAATATHSDIWYMLRRCCARRACAIIAQPVLSAEVMLNYSALVRFENRRHVLQQPRFMLIHCSG